MTTTTTTTDAPAFQTFLIAGIKFLAFPNGENWHIVDERGGNYGAWRSVMGFMIAYRHGDEFASAFKGCRVRVSGQVIYS